MPGAKLHSVLLLLVLPEVEGGFLIIPSQLERWHCYVFPSLQEIILTSYFFCLLEPSARKGRVTGGERDPRSVSISHQEFGLKAYRCALCMRALPKG